MTVQQYALLWAFFLAGWFLIKICFIIPAAFQRLGKFLVYDVYIRLFPKHFNQLVIVVLKKVDSFDIGTSTFLYRVSRLCTSYRKGKQCLKHCVIDNETGIEYRVLNSLVRRIVKLLCSSDAVEFWWRFTYTALGYCSHDLLVRLEPFREEILKEHFLAKDYFPEPVREFIKNYHGHHTADGNKGRDDNITHAFPVEQST